MTSGLTGHLARAAAVCAAVICSGALAAGCGGRGGVASATASATASGPAAAPGEATAPAAGEVRASHAAPSTALGIVPAPAHIVLVVLENHSYGDIIGNPAAPFISGLARQGALFTRSFAVTHPSEPNYLALFSGATDGITDDSCPHTFRSPNLAADLAAAHRSFTGYAESLPARGSAVCVSGEYARKHVPWADFANVPAASSQPLANFPGADLAALPTVAWVIPNLCHDMHDCSVSTGTPGCGSTSAVMPAGR